MSLLPYGAEPEPEPAEGEIGHLSGEPIHRWMSETLFTVPAVTLAALPKDQHYFLEVKLDNPSCPFEVHPNGNIPAPLAWKMAAYVSTDATWTKDDARERYYQKTFALWNGDDKTRPDRAKAALEKRLEVRRWKLNTR